MATTSFDKEFVVKDLRVFSNLKDRVENAPVSVVPVRRKNLQKESAKGIELLKKSLSV